MRETMFDESYNIREVLDDVIERVTLREKDRKSTRLNSSHLVISYAVFCLKKKNITVIVLSALAAYKATPHQVGHYLDGDIMALVVHTPPYHELELLHGNRRAI